MLSGFAFVLAQRSDAQVFVRSATEGISFGFPGGYGGRTSAIRSTRITVPRTSGMAGRRTPPSTPSSSLPPLKLAGNPKLKRIARHEAILVFFAMAGNRETVRIRFLLKEEEARFV